MSSTRDSLQSFQAVGTMSGTSLDGVDAAVLETDGHRIIRFGPTRFQAYNEEEKELIKKGFGHWQGSAVSHAEEVVNNAHKRLLVQFKEVDLIGFHGQTLAHEPQGLGTLQVGNGADLAEELGVPVVWDFRSRDVESGGEGAPLASFFHFACSKWIGATAPLCFLNLGGVGNITYVNPIYDFPELEGALLSFDTGPANAPINDMMRARRGLDMDRGGAFAKTGRVNQEFLCEFNNHVFFARKPPKSLDRNAFEGLFHLLSTLSDADAVATVSATCISAVMRGFEYFPTVVSQILVTGGGRYNTFLMKMLKEAAGCSVNPIESVGLNGDMLEAQAFAYLAVRAFHELPISCPSTTGTRTAMSGGIVSYPHENYGIRQHFEV
ncbi:MAG: anhydro-N-acetylmuramic acid kinase [Aestuariivita sp.]|nr:anhydro-N-acetylmuramic acid kinase [Aestuariivita sp.]